MAFHPTKEQQNAIDNRGGTLLVSAAAGSGKSTVLVERMMQRVLNEGLNIDQFLIITYTNAAAAELKQKIIKRINLELSLHPENAHLRKQIARASMAQISTIHSMCKMILQQDGYLIELEPDFRLCDESESEVLKQSAIEKTLSFLYEEIENNENFSLMLDMFSAGKNDEPLINLILDISNKVQSHSSPDNWMKDQIKKCDYSNLKDVSETIYGRFILDEVHSESVFWAQKVSEALKGAENDEVFYLNYSRQLESIFNILNEYTEASQNGWDCVHQVIGSFIPAAGRKQGEIKPRIPEVIFAREMIKEAKKWIDTVNTVFSQDSESSISIMTKVSPAIIGLMEISQFFLCMYSNEKRKRKLLDFADLEHLTIQLLENEDGSPSDIACQWSKRYREIMVDEFQDTNEVQNRIFSLLSDNEQNLFYVGDVKQSIYRFRLADPTIFSQKYNSFDFAEFVNDSMPRKITLQNNFRSKRQILDGVNDVFHDLMSVEFGEIDYTEHEELKTLSTDEELKEEYNIEVNLLFSEKEDEEEEELITREEIPNDKPSPAKLEAALIADRILRLVKEKFPISNQAEIRPVDFGDIAVIGRSLSSMLPLLVKEFNLRGIPWQTDKGESYIDALEVQLAIALLEIIDNPHQDIPLITVLRSPIYGFTSNRLAQIRTVNKNEDMYNAVVCCAGMGEKDCSEFITQLDYIRFHAGDYRVDELLNKILETFNLCGLMSMLPDGETRRTNISEFCRFVQAAAENGHASLFDFLLYLHKTLDSGNGFKKITALGHTGVRIMTTHKSKGLEFPVVILCELSKSFNNEDLRKQVLFHSKMGIGPYYFDREYMQRFPTLQRNAIKLQCEKELHAEELRLLYVAMTRAKNKLIMYVRPGKVEKLIERANKAEYPMAPVILHKCRSVGSWLEYYLLTRQEMADLLNDESVYTRTYDKHLGNWDIVFWNSADVCDMNKSANAITQEVSDKLNIKELPSEFYWTNPDSALSELPSSLTVTRLKEKRRYLNSELINSTQYYSDEQERENYEKMNMKRMRMPDFMSDKKVNAREKGIALHSALQFIDLNRIGSISDISKEVERLVTEEYLTRTQAEAVHCGKLLNFFSSELGQKLVNADVVHREFKFNILQPAGIYYPLSNANEEILMQGVIDCWFETKEGLWLIDFKTDNIDLSQIDMRAKEYAMQLNIYAGALSRITGKPIYKKVLWFFAVDREYYM